jgi:hypothetical protein
MADDNKSKRPSEATAVIVAAILGAIVGAVATHFLESPESRERIYIADLSQHDVKANKYATDEEGKYWNVAIENACDTKVYVAVWYTALDGATVVEGWTKIEPHESPRTILRTTWTGFEYTVAIPDHSFKWNEGKPIFQRDVAYGRSAHWEYIDDIRYHLGWYVLPNTAKADFQRVSISADAPHSSTYENFKAATITCSKS